MPEDAVAFSPDPVGREPWNPDTMTRRYHRYGRRVGITSSLKELRHYSATLRCYAQFTRSADQRAAAVIPSQLDGLRKKERLRELYGQHQSASGSDSLAALASVIGPQAGLNKDIALAWLSEFAAGD